MKKSTTQRLQAAAVSVLLLTGVAAAQEACVLCENEIITNASLAECFIAEYEKLTAQEGPAVAVDLSACPASRGVVKSLPRPGEKAAAEPDVMFFVSRDKLECLKKKLQEPGVVLDPTAKISLEGC